MIKQEQIGNLIHTYTDDETKQLKQIETGIIYVEAYDIIPLRYTYEEVDKPEENNNQSELI